MYEITEQPRLSKVTAVTRIDAYKLSYEWKIYNFKISGHKQGECLESTKFGPVENDDIKWSLILYPKGNSSESKDYMSLFLKFHCNEKFDNMEAEYEFGIYDKQRQIKFKRVGLQAHFVKNSSVWGLKNYIKRSDLLNGDYLPNDCLTLICNIFGSMGSIINFSNTCDNLKNLESSDTYSMLQLGYETLYKSEKLFDVTFNISGKTLHAHKAILAAHSPVFLAMFENDMKEKNCGQVDLTDVQFEVFEEMLRFIYYGKTESMPSLVNDLLYLADKYAIQALKDKCEKYLSLKLSVGNVIDTLIVAGTYHALSLKKNAINFFIKYKDELIQNDVFKSITRLQPETWEELTRSLILH